MGHIKAKHLIFLIKHFLKAKWTWKNISRCCLKVVLKLQFILHVVFLNQILEVFYFRS